ncbi:MULTISPECIES: hypothetical protein [Pseudomonas]|uniref:hypothetical protein n=1 Tax=Pseudomonas TaxID=286 RepID=UPI000B359B38|nr:MULTISPECIES: hypothetical protein [Pseudomonas]PMY71019.1 hypothetical protein C1Y31_01670 [Pseudomonas sp. FW305-25]PMY75548.1 hypothetical protein C1Y32_02695 [Pseudomonas sp. FW126-L8]PNA81430.1 hypothetical protein C1Y33_07760 [Pseudomonas sp. FW305-76]
MTRDEFWGRAVALEAKLNKHLEVARKFREADPSLSAPGAIEDYQKLNAESTQASNDWYNFCSANAKYVS